MPIDYNKIIVTTGDIKEDYIILGPVYFQVSNKGIFSSALSNYVKKYAQEIERMKKQGSMSQELPDWGFLFGEWSVGQSDFEKAFFVAVQELKQRAALLGADGIVSMRQDIDLDTTNFAYFYLQMYGTAVKFKVKHKENTNKSKDNLTLNHPRKLNASNGKSNLTPEKDIEDKQDEENSSKNIICPECSEELYGNPIECPYCYKKLG